jgi:type 1 glutamine amidotransferase
VALIALAAGAACAAEPDPPPRFRVLVFSRTLEFRHASISDGIAAIESLGAEHDFAVDASEDPTVFSAANLARYRVVVFLNTTGDVLDPAQQEALTCRLKAGGGWVGVHSAADTEHGWPEYGEILGGGAWFAIHPPIQTATLAVEDAADPSTAHLPASFPFTDEWYNFAADPRPVVHVLLTIDESSYAPGPGAMGDHPIAWRHAYGDGRAWYTNLGHRSETYADPLFLPHLLGGIEWAAGCEAVGCAVPIFRDGFESGSTCLWIAAP